MKNKKGFTLVEILAVIVIIGIISGLLIPNVIKYFKKSKDEFNTSLENELVSIAKDYYSKHLDELPNGVADVNKKQTNIKILWALYLTSNNYLTNDLVDADSKSCENSYIVVEKNEDKYNYTACMICNEGYTTKNDYCNFTNIIDNDLPECTIVSDDYPDDGWTASDIKLKIFGYDKTSGLSLFVINGKTYKNNSEFDYITDQSIDENFFVYVYDKAGNGGTCKLDKTIKVDKVKPEVKIVAKTKTSLQEILSGKSSNEGLNYTLTQINNNVSGATIYYCKDKDNICEPNIKIESGKEITDYNKETGLYYIRYKIVSGALLSSSVNSYEAKVNFTYNIKYNSNGGIGTIENSSCLFGETCTLTKNTFTKAGYIFMGWTTDPNSNTINYTDGTSINNNDETKTIINLYAVWKTKPIYVYYNVNGGSISGKYTTIDNWVAVDSENYLTSIWNKDTSADLYNYNNSSYMYVTKANYSTNSGYEWNTQPDGSGTSFNQATTYSYSNLVSYAQETPDMYGIYLYINWKRVNSSYSCYQVTASSGLNCRYNPNISSSKVTAFTYGSYHYFKYSSSADGYNWYYNSTYGCYSAGNYLSSPVSDSYCNGSSGGGSSSGGISGTCYCDFRYTAYAYEKHSYSCSSHNLKNASDCSAYCTSLSTSNYTSIYSSSTCAS